MSKDNQIIGRNIRKLRKKQGLSMRELGMLIIPRVLPQQLTKYESGADRIPMDIFLQIYGILHCSVFDLLRGIRLSRIDSTAFEIINKISYERDYE